MVKLKGLYEWKLINAHTNKIDQEGKQWNVVSDRFLNFLFSGNDDSQDGAYRSSMAILLSDTIPSGTEDYRIAGKSNNFNILKTGSIQQYNVDFDIRSKYCDHNFSPPVSPITIRVIGIKIFGYISDNFPHPNFVSFIELSTPITQNTNQYLYVRYTVFVSYTSGLGYNTPDNKFLEFCMNMNVFQRTAIYIGGSYDNYMSTHFFITEFKAPVTLNNMQRSPDYKLMSGGSDIITNHGTPFGVSFIKDFTVSELTGPIGTIAYILDDQAISGTYYSFAKNIYGYSQVKDNIPSVSRVFVHPAGREEYIFSDPSQPASSQGSVLISGTPNNDFPVIGRIRITKTGDASDIVDEVVNYTAVNTSTDEITVTQNMDTGDIYRLTTTGALPSPLLIDTNYYSINIDATHIQVAASYADAIAGTEIDLTTQGTGDHTLIRQNTGQYNVELEPWQITGWKLYNLSMGIDVDGYIMPIDLDSKIDTPTNYAEGDYIANDDLSYQNELIEGCGSSMLRGAIKNGSYIYTIQQSRKGLINNVCRWLFNTVETSQPLCKFGTGTTKVSTILDASTKMYICTNEGIYEYVFATPTTAPTLLSITGMIDSNVIDACIDPITGYMWTGHTTGLSRVNLSTLIATQYITGAGGELEGMTANEVYVTPGQLDAYDGRVLKGGYGGITGEALYSICWVMDDGVGYYRVNTTSYNMSSCLRKGTNQVLYRYSTYLRLYTVTVTGKNAGSSVISEEFTGLKNWSSLGAQYGQFDTDTFAGVFSYNSSPYQVGVETYRIGITPVINYISEGSSSIPRYIGVRYGSGFSWCLAALKRNQIDFDGNENYGAIWHRYLIMTKLGFSRRYGWNGSSWEKDNVNSRNIPKTATDTIPNGLSVDFNNATGGTTWDQQFIATEHFNYVHGPFLVKDNLQTLQIKARSYFCQSVVVESYGITVPSSDPYEITIPEVSDPNFRDLDTVDFVTEVYEGATQYNLYDPSATTYTVNTSTDILSVGVNIPTGTAVLVYNSNMINPTYIPAPLKYPIIYYAINASPTTIQLAETYADAISTIPIDITTTGSYTQYIKQIIPITETYRSGLQGVFIFSSSDAGKNLTLTYTYTKFTT